jgi:hypothetical protein
VTVEYPQRMPRLDTVSAACKLGFNALRNPSLVGTLVPYARHPFTSEWEAEKPWWNPRAIQYLTDRLPAGGRAFEWGSGGSTVWLSRHGLSVTSVESEPEWAELVTKRCPSAEVRFIPGADEGRLRSEPQLRDGGQHFFDDYVAAIDDFPEESLDLIVIDGICRADCAKRASAKVKPGGMIVIDDTNWSFLDSCFDPFSGWPTRRIRGFKYKSTVAFETSFLSRPVP